MTSPDASSGGPATVRRRTGFAKAPRWTILAGAWLVLLGAAPRGADSPPAAVSVTETERGEYLVHATFQVPQPACIARQVLTDYEQIPRFMPNVRSSVVRERHGGKVLVEQEAVPKMMLFSKRVHLLLEVDEADGAVRFRDRSGRSFERYEGAWLLAQHADHTAISYELVARPAFSVPKFVLIRLLSRDARQMIERLRSEIAARPTGELAPQTLKRSREPLTSVGSEPRSSPV